MPRYNDDELSALIEREVRQSLGAPGSEIADLRLRNMQFYKAEAEGELAGPETPDRSSLVASDVPDTVEWMLPALVRVFASSEDAVECAPRRPEFAPTAKLASAYLRYKFWHCSDGFMVLYQWFKDALVQKVGFVEVSSEEDAEDAEASYKGLTEEQVSDILNDDDVKPLEQTSRVEEVEGEQITVYDIRVQRTERENKTKVVNVPPEEMRIHRRARYDGDGGPFIARVFWMTRGELEAEGYDLEDCTPGEEWSMEEAERYSQAHGQWTDDSDGELQRFQVTKAFVKIDQDKDGVAEWVRVFSIGRTIKEQEKVDGHPFVWFCPNPSPHVFFGQCPADFAIQPQKLNTSLIRGLLDNVYLTVNGRTGVIDGQVNLDDLTNSRPGGIVRMKSADSMVPIVQPGLDQGAWGMVEWGEQWRERRTGFTRQSQGLSPDALNPQTATQVSLATEKADQRVELIARVAGNSVQRMFTMMLAEMGKYQDADELVELNGQWVSVNPREWADGYAIRVNVGLGTGNKDKRAQALQAVYGMQAPLIQMGAMKPDAQIAVGKAFSESLGLGDAETYWPPAVPPTPQPPLPLQLKQAELAADAQKFQASQTADAQKFQATMQAEIQKITAQSQAKIAELQASLQVQASNDERDAVREEQRAVMQAQIDREKAATDREMQVMQGEIEIYKADLEARVKLLTAGNDVPPAIDLGPMQSTLQQLLDHTRAPATIIRDPQTGRAIGVKKMTVTQQLGSLNGSPQ